MSTAPPDDALIGAVVEPAPRRTLWEEGRLLARLVIVLAGLGLGLVLGLDLLLDARIGWILDVGFVLVCLSAALAVRPGDFFGIGVLPPLLMFGVMLVVGIAAPDAIGSTVDGRAQSVVAGLALHSGALFAGYAVTLGVLMVRLRAIAVGQDRAARRTSPYAVDSATPAAAPAVTAAPTAPAAPRPSRPGHVPDWSSLPD